MSEHACKIGLEGVVSKVRDSVYASGRADNWVKKTWAQRETLTIAGFALDEPSALSPDLDDNLFCYCEHVVDLDAEISNGAFDFSMPNKELYGPQVAGSAINQCRLGPAKGMGPEQMRVQSNVGDPVR